MYGRQPQQKPGLALKRRPHFPHIYGPFCPDCGRQFGEQRVLLTHMAMAHRKRHAYYKERRDVLLRDLDRPTNIEHIMEAAQNAGQPVDLEKALLSDMKRVWRLSGQEHLDLVLVEPIPRKPPTWQVLLPICRRIVQKGLGGALAEVPKRLQHRADYVRQNIEPVSRIQQQTCYQRLQSSESKACLLAAVLSRPDLSPTAAANEALPFLDTLERSSEELRRNPHSLYWQEKRMWAQQRLNDLKRQLGSTHQLKKQA